jgi:hypothetical protein
MVGKTNLWGYIAACDECPKTAKAILQGTINLTINKGDV